MQTAVAWWITKSSTGAYVFLFVSPSIQTCLMTSAVIASRQIDIANWPYRLVIEHDVDLGHLVCSSASLAQDLASSGVKIAAILSNLSEADQSRSKERIQLFRGQPMAMAWLLIARCYVACHCRRREGQALYARCNYPSSARYLASFNCSYVTAICPWHAR
jgi:hypothetical protein